MRKVIHWFRNDLRVNDNEALTDALKIADEVIPVYIFDDRIFKGQTSYGFPKTNKYRCKFIIESVTQLRTHLEELGLRLIVRSGIPEDILFDIASELKTSSISCNRERTHEEVLVQDALEEKLWTIGQEMRYYRGKMLYYTSDLPFPITQCPDTFTQFRKEVEKFVPVRDPFPIPTFHKHHFYSDIDDGVIPDLAFFGWEDFSIDKGMDFKGGEKAALTELEYYIWEKGLVQDYFNTRNALLGRDFSTKMSPYLSQGCISPKQIYTEVKKYEEKNGSTKSSYWVIFELMWRDFFRFMGKKHKNKIFQRKGTKDGDYPKYPRNDEVLEKWMNGETGVPFIDANMKELNATGFMSNRGRQNVASYFVHTCQQDWIFGAEYFESFLIDYDPCSNYGNWNYLAGVGSDPREGRKFNILTQARKYDPDAAYVKYWLPNYESMDAKDVVMLNADD